MAQVKPTQQPEFLILQKITKPGLTAGVPVITLSGGCCDLGLSSLGGEREITTERAVACLSDKLSSHDNRNPPSLGLDSTFSLQRSRGLAPTGRASYALTDYRCVALDLALPDAD